MYTLTKIKRKVKGFFMRRRVKTKKILALIRERGLKQKWLAGQIGYHPVTLNEIIHNKNNARLNPQRAGKLAEALGISVDTVLDLFGIR